MSEMARQSGVVLSDKIDTDVFKLVGNSVLTAPVKDSGTDGAGTGAVDIQDFGTVVAYSGADYGTITSTQRGDVLNGLAFEAQVALDKKNVPSDGRVMIVDRQSYADMVQSGKGTNIDYVDRGNGSISNGRIAMMADLPIMWSNNLPTVAELNAPATGVDGNVGATLEGNLLGMVYTPDIAGVVTLIGLQSELNYDFNALGHLLTSYYALGMGTLNPACGVLILDAPQVV